MKITWFGNTAFRLQIGGQILVVDPQSAPPDIDQTELKSAADQIIDFDPSRVCGDLKTWKPRPPQRLLEAGTALRPVEIWSAGPGNIIIDADEDRPLLILTGKVPETGRWASAACVIVVGADFAERAGAVLDTMAPKLMAVAGADAEVDAVFVALRDRLDGTGLVALEPGLAVEA